MENWKNTRNYRKIRQDDESVKNIITVEGVDVEVTDEVFAAYSQADRKERYQLEDQKKSRDLSLERLQEDDMHLEYLTSDHVESAEDSVIRTEREREKGEHLVRLHEILSQLTEKERMLIHALYFECIPVREYARMNEVCEKAIRKRRDRVLKKIMSFF